jgi:uncharacterized membrane protein
VGSTTLQPGEESTLSIETAPAGGHMLGAHLFEITVKSNDPVEPEKKLEVRAYFESQERFSENGIHGLEPLRASPGQTYGQERTN